MHDHSFLTLFNLPGIFGERLFTVFDQKKTGVIDYEEFMTGVRSFMSGNWVCGSVWVHMCVCA
jgi:hypothetical protein